MTLVVSYYIMMALKGNPKMINAKKFVLTWIAMALVSLTVSIGVLALGVFVVVKVLKATGVI